MHGLLSNKNMKIPMKKKNFGDPPSPLTKPILGGKKPKWAVSPRISNKNIRIPMKKKQP